MYQIKATIEGICPVLFNGWTPSDLEALASGKTGGFHSAAEDEQKALERCPKNGHGYYIPSIHLKHCLVRGGQLANLKFGKRGITDYLKGGVFFEDGEALLGKETPDFIHKVPGRRPPKTGGACIITRPGFNTGWQSIFHLTVIDENLPTEHIKQAFEQGGLVNGVGSFRPDYGRFVVKNWEIIRS